MTKPLARVPELSLAAFTAGDAAARARFTDDLMRGLTDYGFIILADHQVRTDLLHDAYAIAAEFFAQPEAQKRRYVVGDDGQRGYTPFGREHAKDAVAGDLKEFWHVGREFNAASPLAARYPMNVWPEAPPRFRDVFNALYESLEDVGATLLDALAPALEVAPGYFRDLTRDGDSILRILHYPPVPADADPRAVRAAAHEDINLITLLVAANGAGLELFTRDGAWLPVEASPDRIIVDAGDMLARITNDIIPATTHRVVNPLGPNRSRYSIPFFMHARPDAMLSCLASCIGAGARYPDITAGAFLRQRLVEIGLLKA